MISIQGFERLGDLLGVDREIAEKSVAKMIVEKRLIGRLDQVKELVVFGGCDDDQDGEDKQEECDKSILEVCLQLDSIYESLSIR